MRRGPLQAGRHHHPRVAAAHAQGRGLPRQQRRREGHCGGERRVRLHAGGRGHARLPHGAREVHRGRLPRGLGRFRRAHRRLPRYLRASDRRGGRHLQRHHAHVLHERHDGQPQGRGAQLRPSARPHHNGEVLAAGAGEQAAHVGDRLRLGQVRLGQDLRPVDRRRHHLRLRHGQVRAHQASPEDPGLQAHHLLRAAHHVPLHAAGGCGRLRSVQRGELRHGRRAAERGGDHSMGAPHRQEDPRGLRPDRGPGASGHLPVDRAEARLHGQAVAPAQREAARRRRPRGR